MGGQLDVVGWEQRKGSGELAADVHLCRFYFLFPVCMSVSIVFFLSQRSVSTTMGRLKKQQHQAP